MRFEHEFTVAGSSKDVWALLTDVPRMAGCIPGASDVTRVDDTTYDATVSARIGPITARFACTIVILDLDDAMHQGSVEVSGKDAKIGGGVKAKMQMALAGDDPTSVRITSDVDVLGKIGQYGHGMIARRADAMLVDFSGCIRERLAESRS